MKELFESYKFEILLPPSPDSDPRSFEEIPLPRYAGGDSLGSLSLGKFRSGDEPLDVWAAKLENEVTVYYLLMTLKVTGHIMADTATNLIWPLMDRLKSEKGKLEKRVAELRKKPRRYKHWRTECKFYEEYLHEHPPKRDSIKKFIINVLKGQLGYAYTKSNRKKLGDRLEKVRQKWIKEHPE